MSPPSFQSPEGETGVYESSLHGSVAMTLPWCHSNPSLLINSKMETFTAEREGNRAQAINSTCFQPSSGCILKIRKGLSKSIKAFSINMCTRPVILSYREKRTRYPKHWENIWNYRQFKSDCTVHGLSTSPFSIHFTDSTDKFALSVATGSFAKGQASNLPLFLASQAFENNCEVILDFNSTKGYLFYSNWVRISKDRM